MEKKSPSNSEFPLICCQSNIVVEVILRWAVTVCMYVAGIKGGLWKPFHLGVILTSILCTYTGIKLLKKVQLISEGNCYINLSLASQFKIKYLFQTMSEQNSTTCGPTS